MGLLENGRVLNELQTVWARVGNVENWTRRQWRWQDSVVEQQGRYEETRCAEALRRQK